MGSGREGCFYQVTVHIETHAKWTLGTQDSVCLEQGIQIDNRYVI